MTTTTTSVVYINVIEDVINKVREEFAQTNVDETVLNELQALWEMKMMQCGVICGPIERQSLPKLPPQMPGTGGGPTPVHDLNVPYEPTEEYETPTAEMLFPPTPLQTPMQTPLPGTVQTPLPGNAQTPLPGTAEHGMYQLPTPSDYASGHDNTLHDVKPGRPSPYMQAPSPWMNQRPLGVDVNVAYVEGRDDVDRGNPHQPMTQDFFMMSAGNGKRKRDEFPPQIPGGGGYIPQQDGGGDTPFNVFQPEIYPYQGVASEDYNAVNTPAPPELHTGTPNLVAQIEAADDDEEPPLNENDDDDDLDEGEDGEEPNTQHLVLAQFDKVGRTKSRWKCTLKDGIMHINNKDILFTKATGEFEF